MGKKYLLPVISLLIAILVINHRGDKWEQPVRNFLYNVINDSVPAYSREYTDEQGIPYVDYRTLNGITPGKQYNPTIVCNYALDYYRSYRQNQDSTSLVRFYHCAEWLEDHATKKDNYALYTFNWRQPWYDSVGVPYTSGMTSGLAIKVFSQAYRLAGDERYLRAAKLLLNGFYVPIQKGGFSYMDEDGWWYEELADTSLHTPRILDGHIFALSGLYEYAQLRNNDSAALPFNKGIQSLKHRLHLYDIGNGWSYYDAYRFPSDRKYHRILTAQMKELYDMTGDRFFLAYHEKWNKPLSRSYIRTIIEDRNVSGIILFFILWILCWVILFIVMKLTDRRMKA